MDSRCLWGKKEFLRRVGIGEFLVSARPEEILVTFALGSCIGVTMYDSDKRVGGMIHCKLPDSNVDSRYQNRKQAMYVDTGIPLLVERILKAGGDLRRLIVKLAGASISPQRNDLFRIGERNYEVVKQLLASMNLPLHAEECGGNIPRTLYLYMADGRTLIRSQRDLREL